jgi:serine/threonine protein kinase, bacterial
VAVDAAGNVYVADSDNKRVLKLAAGSNTATALPFTGLTHPNAVAVDNVGNVYVADVPKYQSRVLKLGVGSSTPTELPFDFVGEMPSKTGTSDEDWEWVRQDPAGVAVDAVGNVYVAATDGTWSWTNNSYVVPHPEFNSVLKLAAGSSTPTVLPFTGLSVPHRVALDTAGNVYVADAKRVLKLAAGSSTPTELPFTGLKYPGGVAVDTAGNVYVTDESENHFNRVLKLQAGSNTPVELPFTGLNYPSDVAVDSAGNVYVADYGNNRVLKLPAG